MELLSTIGVVSRCSMDNDIANVAFESVSISILVRVSCVLCVLNYMLGHWAGIRAELAARMI